MSALAVHEKTILLLGGNALYFPAGRHRLGVVAQLVERLVRNEQVRGSNPLGSTNPAVVLSAWPPNIWSVDADQDVFISTRLGVSALFASGGVVI